MSEEMIEITNEFLQGINDNVKTIMERTKTDEQLYEAVIILHNCRMKLLDFQYGLIVKER